MARVVFRKPVLDFYLNSPAGQVGRHMQRKALMVVMKARMQVGKRTGALQASIHYRHSRDGLGQFFTVGSPLSYALLHHEGTRPHIIVANRAQQLRFTAGSRVVYTRAVMHPGTRPNRFLSDNLSVVKT